MPFVPPPVPKQQSTGRERAPEAAEAPTAHIRVASTPPFGWASNSSDSEDSDFASVAAQYGNCDTVAAANVVQDAPRDDWHWRMDNLRLRKALDKRARLMQRPVGTHPTQLWLAGLTGSEWLALPQSAIGSTAAPGVSSGDPSASSSSSQAPPPPSVVAQPYGPYPAPPPPLHDRTTPSPPPPDRLTDASTTPTFTPSSTHSTRDLSVSSLVSSNAQVQGSSSVSNIASLAA